MEGAGKKHVAASIQTKGETTNVAAFAGERMMRSINELRGLSARWCQIKEGDPGGLNPYHGYEARGI